MNQRKYSSSQRNNCFELKSSSDSKKYSFIWRKRFVQQNFLWMKKTVFVIQRKYFSDVKKMFSEYLKILKSVTFIIVHTQNSFFESKKLFVQSTKKLLLIENVWFKDIFFHLKKKICSKKFLMTEKNIFCHSKKIFLWRKETVFWISEDSEFCNIYNSAHSEQFLWINETIRSVNEKITFDWKYLIQRNILSFEEKDLFKKTVLFGLKNIFQITSQRKNYLE